MAAAVRINGLNEVTRNLKLFGATAEDLKEANSIISGKVAADAAAAAPKKTGRLSDSVRGNRQQRKASVIAGGSSVRYAGVIEYGYPKRNIKAQPFIRRAGWQNQSFIIEQYEKNINSIIRKYNLQ
jgi:hypothetical protein